MDTPCCPPPPPGVLPKSEHDSDCVMNGAAQKRCTAKVMGELRTNASGYAAPNQMQKAIKASTQGALHVYDCSAGERGMGRVIIH